MVLVEPGAVSAPVSGGVSLSSRPLGRPQALDGAGPMSGARLGACGDGSAWAEAVADDGDEALARGLVEVAVHDRAARPAHEGEHVLARDVRTQRTGALGALDEHAE